MPRGLVLPFPSSRGLMPEDRACLRDLVVSYPGTVVEFLDAGRRRDIAVLGTQGRRFRVERVGAVVHIRDAENGRLLAEAGSVDAAFAEVRAALLPCATDGRDDRTEALG